MTPPGTKFRIRKVIGWKLAVAVTVTGWRPGCRMGGLPALLAAGDTVMLGLPPLQVRLR
jgi:hypothetical protein